jgi:hypothetical protein
MIFICCHILQTVSQNLGTGKVKSITKEEALLNKDIEVSKSWETIYTFD